MSVQSTRKFSIMDAMILIAATAVALVWARTHVEHVEFVFFSQFGGLPLRLATVFLAILT